MNMFIELDLHHRRQECWPLSPAFITPDHHRLTVGKWQRYGFHSNLLIINVNLCGIYFNDCTHVYDIMVNFEDFVYKANICKFQLMFLQWHSMRKVWYKYHICMQISCENSYICRSTFILIWHISLIWYVLLSLSDYLQQEYIVK